MFFQNLDYLAYFAFWFLTPLFGLRIAKVKVGGGAIAFFFIFALFAAAVTKK